MAIPLTSNKLFTRSNALNWICLLILILTVSIVVYYRVRMQTTIGPFWDTYSFLDNALEYAGMGTGYIELDRSPFLPFLTSLLFRMGFVSEVAIYVVEGLIFIFGVIGLYLLLKLRFNPLESLAGSTIYISFPVILVWLGIGYLDIAAVALSIWAVYLTILAVKKNPRYFYLAFPMAMMAFLTRFTAGFLLFPIILFILIGGNYLRNLKEMIMGLILSILVIIPYLGFMYQKAGDPFITLTNLLSIQSESQSGQIAFSADPLYYLKTMDLFISIPGSLHYWIYYLFILILVLGVIIYLYKLVKNQHLDWKSPLIRFKIFLMVFFVILFLFTFGKIGNMASIGLVVLFCYLVHDLWRGRVNLDLDIFMFSWFLTQFIVHAQFGMKVDRYFLTMLPALVYFLILGIHEISGKIRFNFRRYNLTSYILPLLLVMVALSSTATYLTYIGHSLEDEEGHMALFSEVDETPFIMNATDLVGNKYIVGSLNQATQWLKQNDPDYRTRKIRSNIWPGAVWYLRMYMDPQPTVNTTNLTIHELQKYNIDYYISSETLNIDAYPLLKNFGQVNIYKKDPSKIENKTRMLYIGKNWQNYIDQVLGLKAHVIYEKGHSVLGKSTEIDSHSLEELQQYPYVLLYNFKWHDQEKAEELLMKYVESGGTLVIDASGNMEGTFYSLDNSEFLHTIITRKRLPENPRVEPESVKLSPFLDDGQPWYGADYQSTGENKIEPLVTANGRTLIGVQKIGKGRIIWIGYNFVWHAFHTDNKDEMRLIQESIGI